MNLQCRVELGTAYKAGSQIARVLSEDWCRRELYCAACDSDRLLSSRTNTPAVDFICPRCDQLFQLKSLKKLNPRRIVDAGYDSMVRAIRSDKVPNLLILHYSTDWLIKNLLLIPSAFFSETAIEKRAPLSSVARRAGWVGCNILLDRIPQDGKIAVVSNGCAVAEKIVREEFSRVKQLAEIPPTLRGWTLDVLTTIRKLGKLRFSLQELYELEPYLQSIHPLNRNVRPKIRQQLQVLRNLGLVEFTNPGHYVMRGSPRL
jgi:type II restriction enzyme